MSCKDPVYAVETDIAVEEFRTLLIESGLSSRRPVDDYSRLEAMLKNSNLVVSARIDNVLVGVARSVTDFTFCCYLSDLAVSMSAQRMGIGARLIAKIQGHLGPSVSLILSSVPESIGFYESIGMQPLPNCFWYKRKK